MKAYFLGIVAFSSRCSGQVKVLSHEKSPFVCLSHIQTGFQWVLLKSSAKVACKKIIRTFTQCFFVYYIYIVYMIYYIFHIIYFMYIHILFIISSIIIINSHQPRGIWFGFYSRLTSALLLHCLVQAMASS